MAGNFLNARQKPFQKQEFFFDRIVRAAQTARIFSNALKNFFLTHRKRAI